METGLVGPAADGAAVDGVGVDGAAWPGTVTTAERPAPACTAPGVGPTPPVPQTCKPAPRTRARPVEARNASAPTALHTVEGTERSRVTRTSFRGIGPKTGISIPLYGVYPCGDRACPERDVPGKSGRRVGRDVRSAPSRPSQGLASA